MKPKTCMITGHRKIEESKVEYTKEARKAAIMEAIEQGYTHFISDFAEGVDLYFATIGAQLKETHNLSLEAALPYRDRIYSKDAEFQRLILQCSIVGVHSEEYTQNCYLICNRFMVHESDLVIAVYDGIGNISVKK